MNTTPITTDRITLMTHDGLSLLLRRTFRRLSEVTRMHHNKMMEATEEDYEAMFRHPDIASATLIQLDELMASLTDARAELLEIEDYWNSIPWSEVFSHPDPRVTQREDEAPRNGAAGSLAGSPDAASGFDAQMTAGGALNLAQAVERRRVEIEGQTRVADIPGRVVVGPPSPDFEPSLLAAKRVSKVNISSDVRTRFTVGQDKVEHQVGGPPVIWLEAADGTRVAVIKEDVAKLSEVFAKMA